MCVLFASWRMVSGSKFRMALAVTGGLTWSASELERRVAVVRGLDIMVDLLGVCVV